MPREIQNSVMQALVVDDEVACRRLTVLALAQQGFHCESAANGDEALDILRGRGFDVVVTDLRMPHMHGHALAVAILGEREIPGKIPPAIVVLTGISEPRLEADLLARGVERVYFKPVDYRDFAKEVRQLADARRQRVAAEEVF